MKLQHSFANKYSGFSWNIRANDAWSPSDDNSDYFRPDWSAWKRNGTGTTLIQDIQAHIDGKKTWFAIEFDCYACQAPAYMANLRFPVPNDVNPASVIMEVQTDSPDVGDVIAALQVAAGLNPANINKNADMNNDGKIAADDAVGMIQKIAGIR